MLQKRQWRKAYIPIYFISTFVFLLLLLWNPSSIAGCQSLLAQKTRSTPLTRLSASCHSNTWQLVITVAVVVVQHSKTSMWVLINCKKIKNKHNFSLQSAALEGAHLAKFALVAPKAQRTRRMRDYLASLQSLEEFSSYFWLKLINLVEKFENE